MDDANMQSRAQCRTEKVIDPYPFPYDKFYIRQTFIFYFTQLVNQVFLPLYLQ